jgi:hypothetical protein
VKRIGVLVGAGASYGAFDEPSLRPPLGSRLYDVLREEYPNTWGRIDGDLDAAFRDPEYGFERGMADLWQHGGSATQPALLDMGAYFTRFRFDQPVIPNRYIELVALLEARGSLITWFWGSLNYEILLEITLFGVGYDPFYDGDRPDDGGANPALVLKPHGSCNFVPAVGGTRWEGPMGFSGGHIWVDGNLDVKDILEVEAFCRGSGIPAGMSLYAEGKHSPVINRALEAIRAQWDLEVRASDAILVVGARPVPDNDVHVWNPIMQSEMPVALIGSCGPAFEQAMGSRLALLSNHFDSGLSPVAEWLDAITIAH